MERPQKVEILIVGFGFSCITLLRELEKRGQSYTVVSEGSPIWAQLKEADRLNFELVSSVHASVYTEDLVRMDAVDDYFMTSKEFYQYHEDIFQQFREKVTEDRVQLVENHLDHSLVYTKSGKIYKATHLVLATGLGRPQNDTIKNLDVQDIREKTVVISSTGDTGVMMMQRLVPQDNKVIFLNNGFLALEKFASFDAPGPKGSHWFIPILGIRTGKHYGFDPAQVVPHTLHWIWPKLYGAFFSTAWGPHPSSWFAKLVMPHLFQTKFPETFRESLAAANQTVKAGISAGIQTIKFYAIDVYKNHFGDDLEKHISNSVLMNDITFFHAEGLVESWRKDRTTIDRENKTISNGGKVLSFDLLIEGAPERPRLPPIVSVGLDGSKHYYDYNTRDTFMGVVPADLKNVYLLGFMRPTTGGIAVLTEMQCLMVHKLISNPKFAYGLYSTIRERIAKYNAYYFSQLPACTTSDHLMYYGIYVSNVARFIGINRNIWSSAFTWNLRKFLLNLRFELLSPSNVFKFRMTGEYKVEGAEELVHKIAKETDHWIVTMQLILSTVWDILLGHQCLAMMFYEYGIKSMFASGDISACVNFSGLIDFGNASATSVNFACLKDFIAFGLVYTMLVVMFEKNYYIWAHQTHLFPISQLGWKSSFQPVAMVYIAFKGEWYWCLGLALACSAVSFIFRQFHAPPLSGRYVFSDMKYKHMYRGFWQEYKDAYNKVHAAKTQ